VAISSSVIRLESGENLHAITQVEDITARKAAETELTWLVTHDPLTRLLNRAGLHEHLVAALLESQLAASTEGGGAQTPQTGALLYCDLDGFKAVNDTHGHDIGDRVLRVAGNRLTEHVRDKDGVARLGGDEFVIVAKDVSLEAAIALAERIVASLAEPLQVDGITVQITVSVGIAPLSDVSGAAGPDVAALLHTADSAMYQAKANGRNGHAVRRRSAG
jgi:diguanylate cyclase (GGDEF)-like protein